MPETKWLLFDYKGQSPSGKTERWDVVSKAQGAVLGTIQWFGRWRQYTFDPKPGTTFNRACLQDLAEFLLMAQDAQRERKVPDA